MQTRSQSVPENSQRAGDVVAGRVATLDPLHGQQPAGNVLRDLLLLRGLFSRHLSMREDRYHGSPPFLMGYTNHTMASSFMVATQ